jgi:UDP-N-acetylglucosamine--N-acetylmuramyl-(pentapeptide) pyrophosphoryl-undecaprenol N-acetylglucosamine transferase
VIARADDSAPTALLAGGGTAGHLAPGFALRQALARQSVSARFLTPGEERERAWFPKGERPLCAPAPRPPRRPLAAALFPLAMARAVLEAHAALRRARPAAVVALGGWPCAPAALAALLSRVPLALLAADAVPGAVVRRLARHAGRTYVATPDAARSLGGAPGVRVVGRLVRPDVLCGRRDPTRFGLEAGRVTLYVVGGSLGARRLNAAAVEGLAVAISRRPGLARRVQVLHSTGAADRASVESAYRDLGVMARVEAFVEDVGDALATADLVLCRGGASTVAELEATGRPAVVVPYPHHADRQQWRNAQPLVARGAAVLVEEEALTADAFDREVVGLLLDGQRRASMEEAAAAARPASDAAALLASDLVRFIEDRAGGRRRSPGRSTSRPGAGVAEPAEADACRR